MNPLKVHGETSPNDWLRPSVIALLLANLVPVFGVVVPGWEVFPLMFLFWSENVIIGALNVLKLLIASPKSVSSWAGKFFNISPGRKPPPRTKNSLHSPIPARSSGSFYTASRAVSLHRPN